MFINIITPCTRPENLHKIAESIKIPEGKYKWIVVHDAERLPEISLLPNNAMHMAEKIDGSVAGHGQRNFGLNFIDYGKNNWVYFNDDDTTIHPDLWDSISGLDHHDFLHFYQEDKDHNIRLCNDDVAVCRIDSHNFLFKTELLGSSRFIIGDYCADGHFATEIYQKAQKPLYIQKVLSTYNSLR